MVDNNSTSIDDLEQKKWIISRIDVFVKTIHEEFHTNEQRFDNLSNNEISEIKSKRTDVWSILGVILTILIGLNTKLMPIDYLYVVISVNIGFGIAWYIVSNWQISKEKKIYQPIQDSIIDAQNKINEAYGYFINKTRKISDVKIEFADNYLNFIYVLGVAVKVPLYLILKKIREENKLDDKTKKEFLDIEENFRGMILKAFPSEYLLNKDELPEVLVKYIKINLESTMEYKNFTQP